MNLFPRKLSLALLSVALVITGCTKKPQRPDPSYTMAGPDSAINTQNLGTLTDSSAATLTQRDPNIIETDDMIRGLLQPVYFDFDKSAIKQGERPKISAAIDYLKQNPQYRLLFEGHCDWRGTAEYNLGLGDRRAQNVRQFAQTLGIATDRLETLSKGDLDAAENASEEQMGKDRRVDIVVLKK